MDMQGMMALFSQNPQALLQRYNVPQEFVNNPNGAIQYLMNTGRLTQAQYNQAAMMSRQMQNNPMFSRLFQR